MTPARPYNGGMNLLSVQGQGFLYALCLFFICVAAVHLFKLARIGYRTLGKKVPAEKPKKQKTEKEPVYFLVERKKKRSKPEYDEPKRISFK